MLLKANVALVYWSIILIAMGEDGETAKYFLFSNTNAPALMAM